MDPDMARRIKRGIFLIAIVLLLWVSFASTNMSFPGFARRHTWQEIAALKRTEIHNKIPKEWILPSSTVNYAKQQRKITGSFIEDLLDKHTLEITSLDPVDITERLQTGSLTSVEVVTAFCKRSAISHQLVGIELFLKFPISERFLESESH